MERGLEKQANGWSLAGRPLTDGALVAVKTGGDWTVWRAVRPSAAHIPQLAAALWLVSYDPTREEDPDATVEQLTGEQVIAGELPIRWMTEH